MKEVVVERRRRFDFFANFFLLFFRSRLSRRPLFFADVVSGVGDVGDVVLEAADEGREAVDGEDGLLLEEGVAGGGSRILATSCSDVLGDRASSTTVPAWLGEGGTWDGV